VGLQGAHRDKGLACVSALNCFSMKNENVHWRKAKSAALILERQERGVLRARDRRLAALLARDEGVTDHLIHQARLSRLARLHVSS